MRGDEIKSSEAGIDSDGVNESVRKTVDFTAEEGADAPTVEIGVAQNLAELPHDLQIEIAISELDGMFDDGKEIVQTSPNKAFEGGLQDLPDPAFLIINKVSASIGGVENHPVLASAALPEDLMADIDISVDFTGEESESSGNSLFPAGDPFTGIDENRDTVIPAEMPTMELLDGSLADTAVYPPELAVNLKLIPEFNLSDERLAYDNALREHWHRVRWYISGADRRTQFPKPPSFAEFFQKFLNRRNHPDLPAGRDSST